MKLLMSHSDSSLCYLLRIGSIRKNLSFQINACPSYRALIVFGSSPVFLVALIGIFYRV